MLLRTALTISIAISVWCPWCDDVRADDEPQNVIGGTPVPEGKWRDVVAVIGTGGTCTGTLIAPDIVLTAGHCIDLSPYEVVTDTVDYLTPRGDRIAVKWARAYPSWETRYDIGVIMLDHVARGRARRIAGACEAKRQLVEGALVHLVGFGLTSPSADGNNTQLREVDLRVVDPKCLSDAACAPSVAPHGEFIAGGSGADSCLGDSGGPVFVETAEGPALIGVVSRGLAGVPCGGGGVYVRADKVVSWLQSVTGVRLRRTSCDRPTDDAEGDEESGGCAATGGSSGLGVTLLVMGGITSRRRRATSRS